jgi:hypothetical protein
LLLGLDGLSWIFLASSVMFESLRGSPRRPSTALTPPSTVSVEAAGPSVLNLEGLSGRNDRERQVEKEREMVGEGEIFELID